MDTLTPAQSKWLGMVEVFYPEIYESKKVSYPQLLEIHAKFMEMRQVDPKYKVGWPLWLITNNFISRGVYSLPVDIAQEEEDQEHPYYNEYLEELKRFGIVA